ncbi:MAG: hypothetical protein JSU87_04795 [Gemmatimonadota bacterium]|nr:MAG: hypothetical protein JSU87_04795 [Gemmatimonadota bacterium]
MLRTLLLIPLILAGAAIGIREAAAQQISSPYEFIENNKDVGPLVAYVFTDRGAAKVGPQSNPLYGVQATFSVSTPLKISAFVAYFPSERDVIDPTPAEGDEAVIVGTKPMDLLLIAGRLHLSLTGVRTWNRLAPFLTGGAGIALGISGSPACTLTSPDPDCQVLPSERFDFGSSLLIHFGTGTVWLPTRRIGVRLEVLNSIWRLKTPDGFRDFNVVLDPVPPETDWTNNIQLSAALTYWF